MSASSFLFAILVSVAYVYVCVFRLSVCLSVYYLCVVCTSCTSARFAVAATVADEAASSPSLSFALLPEARSRRFRWSTLKIHLRRLCTSSSFSLSVFIIAATIRRSLSTIIVKYSCQISFWSLERRFLRLIMVFLLSLSLSRFIPLVLFHVSFSTSVSFLIASLAHLRVSVVNFYCLVGSLHCPSRSRSLSLTWTRSWVSVSRGRARRDAVRRRAIARPLIIARGLDRRRRCRRRRRRRPASRFKLAFPYTGKFVHGLSSVVRLFDNHGHAIFVFLFCRDFDTTFSVLCDTSLFYFSLASRFCRSSLKQQT